MLGSLLVGCKLAAAYCLYGLATWAHYAAFPPLLYITFLAEFLSDDTLDLDTQYYSEMREAGCFE